MIRIILTLCYISMFFIPMTALAGELDAPASPDDSGSAMYSLETIYERLNSGTPGAKRTGSFTEPVNGPTVSTGHSLDEVMELLLLLIIHMEPDLRMSVLASIFGDFAMIRPILQIQDGDF